MANTLQDWISAYVVPVPSATGFTVEQQQLILQYSVATRILAIMPGVSKITDSGFIAMLKADPTIAAFIKG